MSDQNTNNLIYDGDFCPLSSRDFSEFKPRDENTQGVIHKILCSDGVEIKRKSTDPKNLTGVNHESQLFANKTYPLPVRKSKLMKDGLSDKGLTAENTVGNIHVEVIIEEESKDK